MAKNHWVQDPREALRVGAGFDLSTLDTRATPGWEGSKSGARDYTDARGVLLAELQERLYAHGRSGGDRSLLIVVQGLDTAGKGGVARHVMGYVDPQGVQIRAFGAPTEEELAHHYLWRIKNALPAPGRIGVFDRSHYEDVLVVRVDELVEREVWEQRYEEINQFEKELVDSGTVVLKFALMVSYEEQGLRLMERIDRPDKRWKYATSDLKTRAKWDQFQQAYQAVFDLTSTDHAPWYVIPSDRKWYTRLAITEIVTRALSEMRIPYPDVDWDPQEQRRELAATMSTATLAKSLAETRSNVEEAMEEAFDVRAEVRELLGASDESAERQAAVASDVEQALQQKTELLQDRSDRDDPAVVKQLQGTEFEALIKD